MKCHALILFSVFTLLPTSLTPGTALKKNQTDALQKKQLATKPLPTLLAEITKLELPTSEIIQQKARTVLVKNDVTTEMITYKKHYTGKHTPNEFNTRVNDTIIEPGATAEIAVPDDGKLSVSCFYRFKKGPVDVQRTKEKTIQVSEGQKLSVQFSWDHDDRVIIIPQETKVLTVASK